MEHQDRFEKLTKELEKLVKSLASQSVKGARINSSKSLARDLCEAQMIFTELKSSSRKSHIAIEGFRNNVSMCKKEMDSYHLQLQNLLYERDHLLRETQLCRDFTTKEVDKMEEDEGESFVEGLNRLLTEEQHQTNLNILAQQLKLRKSMKKKLNEAKIRVDSNNKAVDEQRKFLEKLPGYLSDVEKSTAPLQRYMPKLKPSMRRGRHHQAAELPGPLYTLFGQLEAHCDAV
ncbi:unnamed protein product, partial [Choristocarpus tenellus]